MENYERIAKLEVQVEAIKDDVAELKDSVKEIHSRITTGNREIMDKISSMEQCVNDRVIENSRKIQNIEKWKWMIAGGAAVLGYLLGNFDVITKIIH